MGRQAISDHWQYSFFAIGPLLFSQSAAGGPCEFVAFCFCPVFRLKTCVYVKPAMFRVLTAVLVVYTGAVTWIKSPGGANCEHTCAARDGCNEDVWPKSEEEFKDVAKLAGVDCVTTQEGGAKYDPSTDGRHCGWSGPEASRCAEAGDSGTYRFCPCNSDREL
eukprot:symbB.v1.2.016637.t1/scaffold1273.1/size127485/1